MATFSPWDIASNGEPLKHFGMPQKRNRLFIIAYRRDVLQKILHEILYELALKKYQYEPVGPLAKAFPVISKKIKFPRIDGNANLIKYWLCLER